MLSPREKSYLNWLSQGRTIGEIAVLEGKPDHDIEACIARAIEALRATSIEQALENMAVSTPRSR